ncbi:hypothetical protein M0804_005461 [Polistes exclamans]|nr:hypothetical protein M0804_005461 [Polistes exclamans]
MRLGSTELRRCTPTENHFKPLHVRVYIAISFVKPTSGSNCGCARRKYAGGIHRVLFGDRSSDTNRVCQGLFFKEFDNHRKTLMRSFKILFSQNIEKGEMGVKDKQSDCVAFVTEHLTTTKWQQC